MNTRQKGKLAETKVELRAIEKNIILSWPSIDVRYDCIMDNGTSLVKAQIKYADGRCSNATGSITVKLQTNYANSSSDGYSRDEIDVLLVYLPLLDKLILLPPEIWEGKKAIQVRYEPTKNNIKKGITMVDDYLW